jgi:DNA-binding NarL/FixJ family response regulator
MKNSPDAITQHIRVLLADDHPVVREGLAMILKSQKDIKIVAEAADGEEVCKLYDQLSPDVLLLDLRMPKKDGLQVVAELVARCAPKPRIIVMTSYESEQNIRQALKPGPKRSWSKEHPLNKSGKLYAGSREERASFRQRSGLNLRNQCPILNCRAEKLRFCSIWLVAEATKRLDERSTSVKAP